MRGIKHVGRFWDGVLGDEVLEDELIYLRRRRSARSRRRTAQDDLVDRGDHRRSRGGGKRAAQVVASRQAVVNTPRIHRGGRE